MEFDFMTVSFYIVSTLIIVSSLAMMVTKKVIHTAVFLLFSLLATSAYYFLLNADFIAVLQIFVYAGAITVLILFVIMLTLTSIAQARPILKFQTFWSMLVATVVLVTMTMATLFFNTVEVVKGKPADLNVLGEILFTKYLFPFELASVILLVALIGAVYLAKEDDQEELEEEDLN